MQLPEGLFPILDENFAESLSTSQIIEAFLDAEATPFIVRNKEMSADEYRNYIFEIDEMKKEMEFDYIVHHDLNIFLKSNASGIHLTSMSTPVKDARKTVGKNKIIGYSAHSLEEARTARSDGADYIYLGAIFDTPKPHKDHPILGLNILKETCRKIEIPIYAIGGITSENLIQIRDAGAAGFSALRAVYCAGEVEHNISKLNFIWQDLG